MAKNKQFQSSICCITIILKIFGVLNWAAKKSIFLDVVYKIFLLGFYYVMFALAMSENTNAKETTKVVNNIIYTCLLLTFTSILLKSLQKKNDMIQIFERFELIDSFAKKEIGFTFNYKRTKTLTIILSVMTTVILVQATVIEYVYLVQAYELGTVLRLLITYFPMYVTTYFFIFLTIIGYLLYQRFKGVNECLHRIQNCFNLEEIRKLQIMNDELRIQTNKIISCFSLPISFNALTSFFVITVHIYFLSFIWKEEFPRTFLMPNEVTLLDAKGGNHGYFLSKKIKVTFCVVNNIAIQVLQFLMLVACFRTVKLEVCTFSLYSRTSCNDFFFLAEYGTYKR